MNKTLFAKKSKSCLVKDSLKKRAHRVVFRTKKDALLYVMCILPIVYFIVFKYWPMYGLIIAFKDYNVFKGVSASSWVGLEVFKRVFDEPFFWISVKNTLVLNFLTLLASFPLTIILALMLNEVRSAKFKKISQSILYLPHFVSWVIVAGLITNLFSATNGSINLMLAKLGMETIPFLSDERWWMFTYTLAQVWKSIGWGSIIFLAALSGVDESLYEAAYIDGATKMQRIWHITLPCIKATVIIMFILQISKMMTIGLDAPLLLQNAKVIGVSEVISTYVYKVGLTDAQYSFATAVGLFQSVINISLLLFANLITKLCGEEGVL